MSKDKIADYDGTTAGNNTDIGGISIAEGMLPSAVNNSMRELTKQLGAFANGTDPIDALTVTGAATVNGAFTSPGIDDNADSTAITIDSSENVGIGTASPSGVLHTAGSGDQTVTFQAGGESKLEMKIDGNSDGCSIRFSDSDAASQGQIRYQHSTDALIMYTNGNNERIRLLSSGGITFNGDTAAANALDDYEEGTWVPTVYGSTTAGSYTYTTTGNSPYANYTKIGRTVTLQVMLNNITESSAGSGDVFIGGLPFNKMAGSAPFGCVHLNNWNTTGTITGVTVHPTTFANSGDVLQLTLDFDNSSSNSLSLSHLKSGSSDIGFSLVYFTA